MIIIALLLNLLLAVTACAGGLTVTPASVVQGGVVTLRYAGERPTSARVNCFSKPLLLHPDSRGAVRLLGVDLATAPGEYRCSARVATSNGGVELLTIPLQVLPRSDQVERLSLPDAMVSPKAPETLERISRESVQLQNLYALESTPRFRDRFRLPVADQIGSRFGLRRILNGQPRSPHAGVDFRSPRGRKVHAPAPAVVVATGDYFFTGRTVVLDHGGGLISLYAHLESIAVAPGDEVVIDQKLGEVGSSGRATGAHLHWSVRLNEARVDPLALFEVFNGEKP